MSKLVSIFIFFSLIPLSIQAYSLYKAIGVLEEGVGVQYQAVAEGLSHSLEHYLDERSVDAKTMSQNQILRDRTWWYQPGNESNEIVQILNTYIQSSGNYSLIQIVDREGQLIAVNDRDSQGKPIRTEGLYGKNFSSTVWFQGLQQQEGNTTSEGALSRSPGDLSIFVEDVAVDRDVKAIFPNESGFNGWFVCSSL